MNKPSISNTHSTGTSTLRPRWRVWLEAVRLRTLPASVAGVLTGVAVGMQRGHFSWLPALLCLLFAVIAQIGSNFANEYFDYRDGLDRPGREGFRRGVTEGDITPRAMQRAMSLTFLVAAAIGLSLIYWGGWWLLPAGLFILVGALSYSAGPFPLSRNAMGEVAVVVFYGLIPVGFTFYLQAGYYSAYDFMAGLAVGLFGANILIVNNYRDHDDDKAVGKLTTAVVFGRPVMAWVYLINGLLGVALTWPLWMHAAEPGSGKGVMYYLCLILPGLYLLGHVSLWSYLRRHSGSDLNRALGMTAMLLLFYALALLGVSIPLLCMTR